MILSRLLTISAFVGLAFAIADNKYRPACKSVEAAISDVSDVYYPGEYKQPTWQQREPIIRR